MVIQLRMMFFAAFVVLIWNVAVIYGTPASTVSTTTLQTDACSPINEKCVVDFDCCIGTCVEYKCINADTPDLLCQNSMCQKDEECIFNEETFESECQPKKPHFCPPGQSIVRVTSCTSNKCQEYPVCKLDDNPCKGIECGIGQSCILKLPQSCTNTTCLPVATCENLNATAEKSTVRPRESNPCDKFNCSSGSLCFVLRPLKDEEDCENGRGCSLKNAQPICMYVNPCSLYDCHRDRKPYCYVTQKCADKMCPPSARCSKNATEADIAMKKYNFDILMREMETI